MKSNIINTKILAGLYLVILALPACKKTGLQTDGGGPDRLFRPTISGTLLSDGNYITAAWEKVTGAVSYTIQLSRDTFKTIDVKYTIDSTHITFLNLYWEKLYQIQIRANAADTTKSSKMGLLGIIKTAKFPTILNTPGLNDLTDEAVRVSWTTSGAPVTDIKILKTDSSVQTSVSLSQHDRDTAFREIHGLPANTSFIIFLYSGSTVRGWANFTTKTTLTGNIVDLRNISGRPAVLTDTLPIIPAGSIVLLKRDETYTVLNSSYVFTKSVTIMTGSGLSGGPARISMSYNFDMNGTFDSLHFENLILSKAGTSGANYFMNVSFAAKVGTMTFESITTEGVFDNSFIRLKTTGDEVTNLNINNCVIDSFGLGLKYPIVYAGTPGMVFTNVKITNSTFNSIYYFVRQDNTLPASSLVVNKCTFNDAINQGGTFINYSTFPATFTISNSIFGKTADSTNAKFMTASAPVTFSNCYSTRDCAFSSSKITAFTSGITAYTGYAPALFTDPTISNFKIKDGTFAGKSSAGDPRWYY